MWNIGLRLKEIEHLQHREVWELAQTCAERQQPAACLECPSEAKTPPGCFAHAGCGSAHSTSKLQEEVSERTARTKVQSELACPHLACKDSLVSASMLRRWLTGLLQGTMGSSIRGPTQLRWLHGQMPAGGFCACRHKADLARPSGSRSWMPACDYPEL